MGKFVWNMFSLDFGESFVEGRPVSEVVAAALPRTLFLFGGAVLIEYLIGIVLGTFIAWRRGRISEGATIVTSLFFYNMPSFWIGLILISAAGTILLMQTSMFEVMGEDFVLTAKAKGLSERTVRRRHAARNAYLPVVTSLTISLAFAVGGAIILEGILDRKSTRL